MSAQRAAVTILTPEQGYRAEAADQPAGEPAGPRVRSGGAREARVHVRSPITVIKKLLYNDDEQMRPGVLYGLIALAIGIGAYFVYANWTSADEPVAIARMCVTQGCGYTSTQDLQLGETFPGKCPSCGKDSVYIALRCPKCKTANVLNEDRGIKGPTKCSRCGTELRYGG